MESGQQSVKAVSLYPDITVFVLVLVFFRERLALPVRAYPAPRIFASWPRGSVRRGPDHLYRV